jgi:hypothetical protein
MGIVESLVCDDILVRADDLLQEVDPDRTADILAAILDARQPVSMDDLTVNNRLYADNEYV